jgi:predicted XRE-type DNA-binding protein/predicted RNase H-like HicB family nuclease
MTEPTYTATVRRDGRWWLIHIPQLHTMGQARTLAQAADAAQEVIGLYLNIDPDTVSVALDVELPQAARDLWAVAAEQESAARAIASAAASMRRRAIKALGDAGISQADTARALGISAQRVSQLARAGRHPVDAWRDG